MDVGDVTLSGTRRDTSREDWSARRNSRFGTGTATYHRDGSVATLVDSLGPRAVAATSLGFLDPRGLTVDGPVATLVSENALAILAEDRGIELIEDARSRHCRVTIDGPFALSISAQVRLMIDGSLQPAPTLDAWRGHIDWWVFADGELGQAVITIGGYPGDAWTSGGLQASIVARITATNRTGSAIMPVVRPSPANPSQSPSASPRDRRSIRRRRSWPPRHPAIAGATAAAPSGTRPPATCASP